MRKTKSRRLVHETDSNFVVLADEENFRMNRPKPVRKIRHSSAESPDGRSVLLIYNDNIPAEFITSLLPHSIRSKNKKEVIKLYVIQKSNNQFVRVQNNVPTIVTDVRKATVFQKNEAERYISYQV